MASGVEGIHADAALDAIITRLMTDRRRAAVLTLLTLIAGGIILTEVPLELAAIRLGPLSLLWWYVAAAPLCAAAVALLALTSPEA
jgi:hypothetical protein